MTEFQNMQPIQVGKWSRAIRGDRGAREAAWGLMERDSVFAGVSAILWCIIPYWVSRWDEKGHLGGHEEPD